MTRVVVAAVSTGMDIVCRVGYHFDIVSDIKQARICLAKMISRFVEEDDYIAVSESLFNENADWLEENELERPNWSKFENHRICCAMEGHLVVTMSYGEERETLAMARDYRHNCQ